MNPKVISSTLQRYVQTGDISWYDAHAAAHYVPRRGHPGRLRRQSAPAPYQNSRAAWSRAVVRVTVAAVSCIWHSVSTD